MARRGRTRRDPGAVSSFVETFAETGVLAGMPRMPARVFATLLAAENGTMTANELATDLQVSAAAISGAVRYLVQSKLVLRRRPIGARRDEYEAQDSWFTMVTQRDAILDIWVGQVRDGMAAVGPDTPAGKRLGDTAEFFDFMHRELDLMMERWRSR